MPDNSRVEQTLQRLLRILDLSRDVERNLDDAAFRKAGGEIQYVLDENVFELFVRPWLHSAHVETFYANLWRPEGSRAQNFRFIEHQSAVIASEYLFEGALPGAKTTNLYLSDHHRWELARRMDELARELKAVAEAQPDRPPTGFLRKLRAIADMASAGAGSTTKRYRRAEAGGSLIDRDIRVLAAAGTSQEALNRIRVAREASEAVAGDQIIEPLEQLKRLISPLSRHRLHSIQEIYRPTPADVAAQEVQAREWYRRLLAELKQPGHVKRIRDERALWNDAQVLAYLRWAALRALQHGRRLVFVTGDPVMFDTYRRWYVSIAPERTEYFEPFILRRTTQYAPIFNLTDANTDARELVEPESAESRQLSTILQEGLEATLVALSIASIGQAGADQDAVIARARERFALKLTDRKTLADDEELAGLVALMTPRWLREREDKISAIRERWQSAQRAAIGSSFRLLSKRFNENELALAEAIAGQGAAEAGAALKRYISGLLDVVVTDSLELWLPIAADFIRQRDDQGLVTGERPRVPLTMDLELPGGYELAGVVSAWWGGNAKAADLGALLTPEQNPGIVRRPAFVFAIAAALALGAQEANEAERFADVALRAERLRPAPPEQRDQTALELSFLHALTLRFQMAAVGMHASDPKASRTAARQTARQSFNQVRSLYEHAALALARHRSALEAARDALVPERFAVLDIRAKSERAGLELFMATAIVAAQRAGVRDVYFRNAERIAEEAQINIAECIRLDTFGNDVPLRLLERVRLQFIPNIAAAEVIRALLTPDSDYHFQESLRRHERKVSRLMSTLEGAPVLLRAEFLAFQILAGRTPKDSSAQFATLKRDARKSLKLPLDKALFDALIKEFS